MHFVNNEHAKRRTKKFNSKFVLISKNKHKQFSIVLFLLVSICNIRDFFSILLIALTHGIYQRFTLPLTFSLFAHILFYVYILSQVNIILILLFHPILGDFMLQVFFKMKYFKISYTIELCLIEIIDVWEWWIMAIWRDIKEIMPLFCFPAKQTPSSSNHFGQFQ